MPIEPLRQKQSSILKQSGMRRRGSEDGAIAIMTPFVMIIMIGMFGMALDLSRSYNRKAELQQAVDAAALAAASALDGTAAGIDRAVLEAQQSAEYATFSYNTESVSWSRGALTFGRSADGGPDNWMDEATAKTSPSNVFFVRVDTSALGVRHGIVKNFLIPILSPALAESKVVATAVAGRDSINVLPLAICANTNLPATSLPSGELAEYGFRRGVSYDLLNLSPIGRSPENFLVNPVAPAGTVGASMKSRLDIVKPFICTGRMAIPTLQGGHITVERGFPIDSLRANLNSRFGDYSLPCRASTAPADPNVTSFTLANAKMNATPDGLAANTLSDPADPLLTVADKPPASTNTAYGPLWSYAKAVKYSSYIANNGVEPADGYSTYNATITDWGLLYPPGPEPKSYPGTTPYQSTGGPATYKLHRNTRVLNVPLLHCSASSAISTKASVLGIGKFFMTVPVTGSALYAEFAGTATESALGGNARLYK